MQRLLRFTLDLFDPADLPPLGPAASKWSPPSSTRQKGAFFEPNDADALVHRSFDATKKEVVSPLVATPDAAPSIEPAMPPDAARASGFRHPQANREAKLVGTVVGYQLKRARRRTIGFSIRDGGLIVAAPGWVPIGQIESALNDKADWIVRKLREWRDQCDRAEDGRTRWGDGSALPMLGRPMSLRLEPALGKRGAVRIAEGDVMSIALPADAPPEQIRDAVHGFLQTEARRYFSARLDHFAPQLGVRWQRMRLSNAATRWGSASANGSIRLHWRLIQMAPALLDYVVVHELAHLRHMDHSARFWAAVSAVLPDHLALRRQLKSVTLPRWD